METTKMGLKNILNTEIENLQAIIQVRKHNIDGLLWLNNICGKLTNICKLLHKFLIVAIRLKKEIIEVIFLCLRQLICCINYLEKTIRVERRDGISLSVCRDHYVERMIWCLSRLLDVVNNKNDCNTNSIENEGNFVAFMDMSLELISPLVLYPNYSGNFEIENTNNITIDFKQTSKKIRNTIELLIGQTLSFISIVPEADKIALTTLCHKVMKECIDFQEICIFDDPEICTTEKEKRLKAQLLQDALYNLDRLVNDCLLRVFFSLFSDLNQNPVEKMHKVKKQQDLTDDKTLMDKEIAKFDDILDKLILIGAFAIAYSLNAKVKSNLQSCLASCEALGSYLIPAILSSNESDTTFLEEHWNVSVNSFRQCAQEVIDTHAFCLILIDTINEIIRKLKKKFDNDLLKTILLQCDVLQEHMQHNYRELGLHNESALKLYYEDFKLMINECKACLRTSIDQIRIRKRFKILLSVIKNVERSLILKESKNETSANKPLTFGNVSVPEDSDNKEICYNRITESLEVAIDLDEFIFKNDTVRKTLEHRSNIFYDTTRKQKHMHSFAHSSQKLMSEANLKKDIACTKRASKRTSLRVAMFKRQKSLETQRFLGNITSSTTSCIPADTLNLQITDILEQLSGISVAENTTKDHPK